MASGKTAIDLIRQFLSETDPNNSRFDSAEVQLLRYYNLGRKAFARRSEGVKAIFERTTSVGATPGNTLARYSLDPKTFNIDSVYYDNHPVDPAQDATAWNAEFDPHDPARTGVPFMFRRFGDAIDLYFAPDEVKTLEIFASIIPEDLSSLTSPENRLKDDQITAAARWASSKALFDDDRDGSIDFAEFQSIAKTYKKQQNKRGPRFVASPHQGLNHGIRRIFSV